MQHTPAPLASSYAFVNPAVGLLLGAALGGERWTGWVYAALPLIAAALSLIIHGPTLLAWFHRQRSRRLFARV